MTVPVFVPHYGKPEQLERLWIAIGKQTQQCTTIVWDNNDTNLYCTGAWNALMRRHILDVALDARPECFVLATQDCYPEPDCIWQLVVFMDSHPRCAIAGVKQLVYADPDYIYHAGCREAYPAGVHHQGRVSLGQCNASRKMPWVNGSFLMVRSSALPDIGLLDQNMLLCGIESDWCYTARSRGWEVWYCAEAVCLHEVGVSSKPTPGPLNDIMANDMLYWRRKWIGSELFARLATEFSEVPQWNDWSDSNTGPIQCANPIEAAIQGVATRVVRK